MKTSEVGIELIKKFEGCRLTAYKDPVGIPTIGYGHTKGVVIGSKISEYQATLYLKQDLAVAEAKVGKLDNIYHWNQNEFDALVSFCMNIGNITALTNFGKRSKAEIAKKIPAYCKAGGKELKGLKNRRAAELKLFLTPVEEKAAFVVGETYKVAVKGLNVRKAPTINANLATKTSLKKGANILVKALEMDTDGNIWIKTSKGYVAGIYKGKMYVKKEV